MPVALNPTDRKLLIGFGVTLVLSLAAVAYLQEEEEVEADFPSTYSTRSGGAKATYTLLEKMGHAMERWERPPQELPEDASGLLLVMAGPQRYADVNERKAVEQFMENGGTLLATGPTASYVLDDHSILSNRVALETSWKSHSARTPTALTRSAPQVTMSDRASWGGPGDDGVPLYGRDHKTTGIEKKVGKGRLIWLGSSAPLSNAGLKADGNVEFLFAVLQTTGTRRVLWDVYFTEHERQAASPLLSPATLWGSLQLFLVLLCGMWTYSRRLGPVRPLAQVSRLSPVEFVEALGNLYRRRKAANLAVDVALRRFRFALTRRLGLPVTVETSRLADRSAALAGREASEIEKVLRDCESARFDPALRETEAIELARQLQDLAREMRLSRKRQEMNDARGNR